MPKEIPTKQPGAGIRSGAPHKSIKKMMYATVLNTKTKKETREVQEALRGADADKLLFRKS